MTQAETAARIRDALTDLQREADAAGLDALAYLIEMARMEAHERATPRHA